MSWHYLQEQEYELEEQERFYNLMKYRCTDCNKEGYLKDCETGEEQDGWENPPYKVSLCPDCMSPVEVV